MSKKKANKKRGPGRPWNKTERVPPRIARSVRFPPDDYENLLEAAEVKNESVEGFIKESVRVRVKKVLKS